MNTQPTRIGIHYDPTWVTGRLVLESPATTSIWQRLTQSALSVNGYKFAENTIELPWIGLLTIVREYGRQQRQLNFRFTPRDDEAKTRLTRFVEQYRQVQAGRGELKLNASVEEIASRLRAAGFMRVLKDFQLRDLQVLLALENGANFSVPGAGKTTVTLALHLLVRKPGQHLLVIGPKASFPAWREVVGECMAPDAPNYGAEPFSVLAGGRAQVAEALAGSGTRRVINYDLMIQMPEVISSYLSTQPVHLVLDEAHRMKAGVGSQRGAFLLGVAPLPVRRDILTGTPMPQSATDIQSQLDFLWPGAGLGVQISRGVAPADVLGRLYVRTTKGDLGLPKPNRKFHHVEMARGQMALYGIVKSEFLRQASQLRLEAGLDVVAARKSVMRLLQLSANPILALRAIMSDVIELDSGIVDQILEDGLSNKMRAVSELARSLAKDGRKSVIWTIFTDTITQLENHLSDLNPVTLFGAIPSGEPTDPLTREGRISRFHTDPNCQIMIANPAAAGEGISLHKVCHEAIYLDRSYVTTHYLQSIDRIHRLGLPEGVETNIHIFQTLAPQGLGCIDHSVSRRLASKLRALQILLNDADLHEIALDEEDAAEPVAWDIDPEDVRDLIEELEGRATHDEDEAE